MPLFLQVDGDAGGAEGVVADAGLEAGSFGAALDHSVGSCCHMALPVSSPFLSAAVRNRAPPDRRCDRRLR